MAQDTLLRPGEYAVYDVVAVVLAMLKGDTFTADTGRIHSIFYRIRQNMPILQQTMVFSTTGASAFSEDLEDALNTLILSRIIVMSAESDQYIIREKGRVLINELIRPLFTDEELKQMSKIASEFAQEP